jgi:hypothetical protein
MRPGQFANRLAGFSQTLVVCAPRNGMVFRAIKNRPQRLGTMRPDWGRDVVKHLLPSVGSQTSDLALQRQSSPPTFWRVHHMSL